MGTERDVVADFYTAIDQHDWNTLASTLADNVVRVGMQGNEEDTCRGKERYLQYVDEVIGKFEYHDMKIIRIFYSSDRRLASAETVETLQAPGCERTSLHCLKAIELNDEGLITKFDLFWKTPSVLPPTWITVDAIEADRT
jgi:hypothetical protein